MVSYSNTKVDGLQHHQVSVTTSKNSTGSGLVLKNPIKHFPFNSNSFFARSGALSETVQAVTPTIQRFAGSSVDENSVKAEMDVQERATSPQREVWRVVTEANSRSGSRNSNSRLGSAAESNIIARCTATPEGDDHVATPLELVPRAPKSHFNDADANDDAMTASRAPRHGRRHLRVKAAPISVVMAKETSESKTSNNELFVPYAETQLESDQDLGNGNYPTYNNQHVSFDSSALKVHQFLSPKGDITKKFTSRRHLSNNPRYYGSLQEEYGVHGQRINLGDEAPSNTFSVSSYVTNVSTSRDDISSVVGDAVRIPALSSTRDIDVLFGLVTDVSRASGGGDLDLISEITSLDHQEDHTICSNLSDLCPPDPASVYTSEYEHNSNPKALGKGTIIDRNADRDAKQSAIVALNEEDAVITAGVNSVNDWSLPAVGVRSDIANDIVDFAQKPGATDTADRLGVLPASSAKGVFSIPVEENTEDSDSDMTDTMSENPNTVTKRISSELNAIYRIKEESVRGNSSILEFDCSGTSSKGKSKKPTKYAWGKKKPLLTNFKSTNRHNQTLLGLELTPPDIFSKYSIDGGGTSGKSPADTVKHATDHWQAFREELEKVETEQENASSNSLIGITGIPLNKHEEENSDWVSSTSSLSSSMRQAKLPRKVLYHPSVAGIIRETDGDVVDSGAGVIPPSIVQDTRLCSGTVPVAPVFECKSIKTHNPNVRAESQLGTSFEDKLSEHSVGSSSESGVVSGGSSVSYPVVTLPSIVPKINTDKLTPFTDADAFELNLS